MLCRATVICMPRHVITAPWRMPVEEPSAQKLLYNSKSNRVHMILDENKSVHILRIRSFRSPKPARCMAVLARFLVRSTELRIPRHGRVPIRWMACVVLRMDVRVVSTVMHAPAPSQVLCTCRNECSAYSNIGNITLSSKRT